MKISDSRTLRSAVRNESDFWVLVDRRQASIRQFMEWVDACESAGPETSLRLENRGDVARCRRVLPLFDEAWWGAVVYSCFDSVTGATRAAARFASPLVAHDGEIAVEAIDFPKGSVQHHRRQSHGLTGAKIALVSACGKAARLKEVSVAEGMSFEDRLRELEDIDVRWWGRTTYFDLLVRAGSIDEVGPNYRPAKAHLLGSTGPAKGFEAIWDITVTNRNADDCEELLRLWTRRWEPVAEAVGIEVASKPYDSGDFENALCIFQEPPHADLPDPADFGPAFEPERSQVASC